MPKELTHWMLAERAAAALPDGSRLKALVAQHRNAYLGGAVLPDTLAHIFRGPFHPTARLLGQRFHDPATSSYAPVILVEERLGDALPAAVLACLLGVISHMEADIAMHPWVYALSGSDLGEHYRLETSIDLHFLRSGPEPAQRTLERLLCPATREVLATTAGHLFDPEGELPRQAIERALELHCRFQSMYDRTLWKIAVRLLGRVCGSPFREQKKLFYPLWGGGVPVLATGAAEKWRHPESGELRGAGLEDLAQQAVARTAELFGRIEEAGGLAAALADHPGPNLLTGLYGVTKSKENY